MENRSKYATITSKIFTERLSKENILTGLSLDLVSIANAYG